MKKGTLGIIIALVVAALASFGIIDRETADSILSATNGKGPATQQAPAPRAEKPALPDGPVSRTSSDTRWHGWSKSDPQINLTHIFSGEINRRGKPTGFHSRPGGRDPGGSRIDRIKSRPNRAGVYTAEVAIHDPDEKRWKSKFSTFFPDAMDHGEVVDSILHAWKKRKQGQSRPWRGPSGRGFQIEGYLSGRGGINTAYPIYQRN